MFGSSKQERLFDTLCTEYYEKVLRYLYAALGDESAARDTTQEVFLVAWKKRAELATHPNPGGFLFQTAKNLAAKARRQAFARLAKESPALEAEADEPPDESSRIETALDRAVNEIDYLEAVLGQLSDEKRRLYNLYYLCGRSMAEIAALYQLEETTVRMRYVRLRREIKAIAAEVAEKNFAY